MALLCFVLDLRSLSPPILRDLKQSLLQLANLYVMSRGRAERKDSTDPVPFLRDRIGLCYLQKSTQSSFSPEMKIAYRPGEHFSLLDFHHAVKSLPMDCFLPELNDYMLTASDYQGFFLGGLLSDNVLYSWGGDYVTKKVIVMGSFVFTKNEALSESLMDAAERCVTVEFVFFEHEEANACHIFFEKLKVFNDSISDLENCVLRSYLPDVLVFSGLVKRWLQELRNDIEEPLQAIFVFKNSIMGSTNQIFCNLYASSNQIIDGFNSCQTCRCHGYPLDVVHNNKAKSSCCSVSGHELCASDLIENAVRVGEQTVLFLPSSDGCSNYQHVSPPVTFNAIERTNLGSLNEGIVVGTSFVVTPSICHEMEAASDECDKSDLNIQLFHVLCGALFRLDQGLVCSSTCNTETMTDGTFKSFYILQPSDRGPMLLRRLAGSEEILPLPEFSRSNDLVIPGEIEDSVVSFLSKIELRDYNPLQHERGFHSKLNWLVKESLQFGPIPRQVDTCPEVKHGSYIQGPVLQQPLTDQASKESMPLENGSCISEGWEELLIIDEMNDNHSPSSLSRSRIQSYTLPTQAKPLDEKTSRILERLEAPRQQKVKTNSPSVSRDLISGPLKKPLLPIEPSLSQVLKPNFQRLKRKQR